MVRCMAEARFKTTVYLDSDALESLERAARERGEPTAVLVREALAEYARKLQSPMPRAIGVVRSGRKDLTERVEDLLKEGLGRRRPLRRRRTVSRR